MVVLVVGVGYSAYWMLREPKASKKPLTYTHSLSKLCDTPPTYFPDAAAFGGGKPHPVAIFAKTDDLGFDLVRDESSSAPSLEGREVQLVVCLDEVESGPFIVKCTFSDGSVPMYQGRFKGTVREARTGRKVGSVAVDGVTTASACPRVATTKGDEPRLHSAPTVEVVRAAMGSILD